MDRDNTLMFDVPYCSRPEDVRLMPGAGPAVRRLREFGFLTVVITNQSGIARGFFMDIELRAVNAELERQLAAWNARIDALYYCPHLPTDGCACRKPGTLLFEQACREHAIDPEKSFVIGDRSADVEAGARIGARTILIRNDVGLAEIASRGVKPTAICQDLPDSVTWLLNEEDVVRAGRP